MRTFDELQELWRGVPSPPSGSGSVLEICRRLGGGRHESLPAGELTVAGGLLGDRWRPAHDPERLCQVTFMNATVGDCIAFAERPRRDAGDNFFVDLDLSEESLPVGSQVRLGTALLQVTAEPHLGCRKFRARFGAGALRWVNHLQHRALRLRGVNLCVLEPGTVRVGDRVELVAAKGRVTPEG
jgi:MOSC domain-containing protein YiiM